MLGRTVVSACKAKAPQCLCHSTSPSAHWQVQCCQSALSWPKHSKISYHQAQVNSCWSQLRGKAAIPSLCFSVQGMHVILFPQFYVRTVKAWLTMAKNNSSMSLSALQLLQLACICSTLTQTSVKQEQHATCTTFCRWEAAADSCPLTRQASARARRVSRPPSPTATSPGLPGPSLICMPRQQC